MVAAKALAAHSILLAFLGVPAIYYHSLVGSPPDLEGMVTSRINRRINRAVLDADRLVDELHHDPRRRAVFEGMRHLLDVRRRHEAFSPFGTQRVEDLDDRVFALRRGEGTDDELLCVTNVTGESVTLPIRRHRRPHRTAGRPARPRAVGVRLGRVSRDDDVSRPVRLRLERQPQPAEPGQPPGDEQGGDVRAERLGDQAEERHLDVAFVKQDAGRGHGRPVRRDRLRWAAVEGTRPEPGRPVPLVVYRAPSMTRARAVEALERADTAYRVTCTATGVLGVIAAVRAGLGIAIFARTLMPSDLIELATGDDLPELGEIDLLLLTSHRAPTEAAEALASLQLV